MTRPTSSASVLDIVLWFGLAVAWSSSYAVIKIGVETIDPMVLVAGRMTIATLVFLSLFLALKYRLSRNLSDWLSYGVTGLLGSVFPFLLVTYGEQNVDSSLAAILMGITPVATAMLASCTLPDERLRTPLVFGLFGALSGIALLFGPGALLGLGQQLGGQMAIVGATLCYAGSTVYIRRFVTRPPLEMAAGSSLVGTVAIVTAVFCTQTEVLHSETSAVSLGTILYLGLVSTAGANLTYFYLVPRLGATRMSQVNFAVPVGGALLGAIFLDETLSSTQIAGLILIIFSVWLATAKGREGAVKSAP